MQVKIVIHFFFLSTVWYSLHSRKTAWWKSIVSLSGKSHFPSSLSSLGLVFSGHTTLFPVNPWWQITSTDSHLTECCFLSGLQARSCVTGGRQQCEDKCCSLVDTSSTASEGKSWNSAPAFENSVINYKLSDQVSSTLKCRWELVLKCNEQIRKNVTLLPKKHYFVTKSSL